ncbi:hypothetical protein [Streptomyces sp. NPDC005181]|uniref:hypothetical protein n=1 Tax=Streptomyces sp. NPDC005181 TaxID=3156869 RepID=UPI0033AEC991
MAQLVREDVPLVMNRGPLLVEEKVGLWRLQAYAARRVDRAERAQGLEEYGLPAKRRYRFAQFPGAESVWQTQTINLLLARLEQLAFVDFWQGHGNPPSAWAVRHLAGER